MRTSLNNIKAIDDYLLGNMTAGDALIFEANMLLNSDLTHDVQHQQCTYAVIRQYGRRNIKAEIKAVEKRLTVESAHQGFIQRIANLFNKY
jgi:anti-sigma-K factor RskA